MEVVVKVNFESGTHGLWGRWVFVGDKPMPSSVNYSCIAIFSIQI